MAIRVMFRLHLGLPFRQAPDAEKLKVREGLGEAFKKWKESGIKLIGTFTSSAHVDGFAHHLLLEVDDITKVTEMDHDIFGGELGKYVEDFQIHTGRDFQVIEDTWK